MLKKILLFVSLFISMSIYGQLKSTQKIYNNIFDVTQNAFRYNIIGSAGLVNLHAPIRLQSVQKLVNLAFDTTYKAIRILAVGGVPSADSAGYADSSRVSNYANTAGFVDTAGFTSRADTSRYIVDEDNDVVAYGISDVLTADSVGIGTSTPDNLLHIYTDDVGGTSASETDMTVESGNALIQFLSDNGGRGGFYFGDNDTNASGQFYYNNDENMYYFYTGIGATGSGLALTIDGNQNINVTDNALLGLGIGKASIEFDDQATDEINILNAKMGIGTSAPDKELHIFRGSAGTLTTATNALLTLENSGSGYIQFLGTTDAFQGFVFGSNKGIEEGEFSYNQEFQNMSFYTKQVNRMTIDSNGNVGIGTQTPESLFEVNSNSDASKYTKLNYPPWGLRIGGLSNGNSWIATGVNKVAHDNNYHARTNNVISVNHRIIELTFDGDVLFKYQAHQTDSTILSPTTQMTIASTGDVSVATNFTADSSYIRALSVDSLYGSSPITVKDNLILKEDLINNGASLINSTDVLIKSIAQLKAFADSVDEVNKKIILGDEGRIVYVMDSNIVTDFILCPPENKRAIVKFNTAKTWTYTDTGAVFEFLNAGTIYLVGSMRFVFPNGQFIHIDNASGEAFLSSLEGIVSLVGKKLGTIENGLTGAVILPLLQAEFEEGFSYNNVSFFETRWAVLTPHNVARIAYAGQTENYSAGDTVDGSISGASGVIVRDIDRGTTGTLTLANITNNFNIGETVTGRSTGLAISNSLLQNNIFADLSGTILSTSLKGINIYPLIPVSDRVNLFNIAPTSISATINTINGLHGTYNKIPSIFAEGSKDQTDIYWEMFNNSGIPNSTAKAKLDITNNTLTTTISTISTPTPINTIWTDGKIEERFVFQDSVLFYSTGDSIQTTYVHGLADSNIISLHTYTGTLPAGLSAGVNYYVVKPEATSFQISLTPGGDPVDCTSNGDGTNYFRHTSGTSQSGWAIYKGLEETAIGVNGWVTITSTTGTDVDARATVMKSSITGEITILQQGSFVTINSAKALSSSFSTIAQLETDEGLIIYIGNYDGTQDLKGTYADITFKE
jgi:hypothetical protein